MSKSDSTERAWWHYHYTEGCTVHAPDPAWADFAYRKWLTPAAAVRQQNEGGEVYDRYLKEKENTDDGQ
jgi:hypothetical protein